MSRVSDLAAGGSQQLDAAFADYVAGRTIAIVGPAPLRPGDLELIGQHDLTYVVSVEKSWWTVDPDIVFANRTAISLISRGLVQVPDVDWIVAKTASHGLPRTRVARIYGIENPNQVVAAAHDLASFKPADVNVYGADLYLAGPRNVYVDTYLDTIDHKVYNGIISHRPTHQHAVMRQLRERTGWFDRSTAWREALDHDTDTYYRLLRNAWVPTVHGAAA